MQIKRNYNNLIATKVRTLEAFRGITHLNFSLYLYFKSVKVKTILLRSIAIHDSKYNVVQIRVTRIINVVFCKPVL